MSINLKKPRTDNDGAALVSLNAPHELDKKPVMVLSPATEGWLTWICGADDNSESGEPGSGTPFFLEFEDGYLPETKIVDFEFSENVEIHDGQISWEPIDKWGYKDKFSLGVYIPPTNVTFVPGGNGNCNVVNEQGQPGQLDSYIIVPAAGDGYHYVDLDEAVPIPAAGSGFWACDYESGDVSYSQTPGQDNFHLLAVPVKSWLMRNIIMSHPGGWFDLDVYKTEWFHKRWKMRWEVYKETPGDGAIAGWVFVFRKTVTTS